jgi:hypothetical protein
MVTLIYEPLVRILKPSFVDLEGFRTFEMLKMRNSIYEPPVVE